MRIVVCTMYSPAYQELANLTVPNMQQYAKRHGYDAHIIFVEDEKWAFKKHEAFKELFEKGYDLIWYKDVDALITNLTIPITTFTDADHSFFITMDYTELNGGSVIVRNDSNGQRFNELILSLRSRYENEQNCYNVLEGDEDLESTIKILPQQTINAYLYEHYQEIGELSPEEGQWVEGMFVLHTPALNFKKRLGILSQAKIIE